jgi:hypothetical protein
MRSLFTVLIAVMVCSTINAQQGKPTDSTQIRTTITNFYKWYQKNTTRISGFRLYSETGKTPPFKINWKEVDRYLGWLKINAPQLGGEFAHNERLFFKECEKEFATQEKDDVPFGFDGDRFTNSQEPEYTLEEMKKARQWTVKINDATASVEAWGAYTDKGKEVETLIICFEMKKEKGKWTIAKIGCTFAVPAEQKTGKHTKQPREGSTT